MVAFLVMMPQSSCFETPCAIILVWRWVYVLPRNEEGSWSAIWALCESATPSLNIGN